MEYLTVRETAKKWNISTRMVQQLCTAGRIPGAQKFGTAWAIPANAEKPQDPRLVPKQKAAPAAGLLDHTNLMPLMNTPFQPGKCLAAVEAMEDGPQRDIAQAEYYSTSRASRNRRRGRQRPTSPARTRGRACLPV